MRCHDAQEQLFFINPRACLFDVVQNGIARILGNWQTHRSPRLPADANTRRVPVEVVELEPDNVAGTQGKPGEQKQDGPIPQADSFRGITGGDHTLDCIRGYISGQRCKAP